MSEEIDGDETRVFATAAPVEATDLVEDAELQAKQPVTGSPEVGPDAPKATTTAPKARPSAGRPTWHLSLTLGLVIALVGGVLLWVQSPELALLVAGGLIILVGLALALWYLFGSGALSRRGATTRRTTASRGDTTGANRGGSASGGGANRRASANREGGTDRRRRGDANRGDTRSRRPWHRDTDRGGTGASRRAKGDTPGANNGGRGGRDNRGGTPGAKPTSPGGTKPVAPGTKPAPPGGTKPPGGGRQPLARDRTTASGPDRLTAAERRDRLRRDRGYPQSRVIRCGRRPVPLTARTPKAVDAKADEGKRRVRLKPLRWRSRSGKLPVPKPPRAVKPTTPPGKPSKVVKASAERIEWPNVDHDQVTRQPPPRITVPRRAIRLPRRYHAVAGEPSWPASDPDRAPSAPPIPDQRDRRGTVSNPDLLTRAAREQHFNDAAGAATVAAQAKDDQANQLLKLAGDLDGVEGMEHVQEGHYQAAAAAAHDAEVRRGKAAIYGFLSQNPV